MLNGNRAPVVAIIGPGDGATAEDMELAESVGRLCAGAGWAVVTGGRASGVMAAAARGARAGGGISLGILPGSDSSEAATDCDIVIPTGLGEARNVLVVLTSTAVIACGMSAGTATEATLALASRRPLVLIRPDRASAQFLSGLAGSLVSVVETVEEAIDAVRAQLGS